MSEASCCESECEDPGEGGYLAVPDPPEALMPAKAIEVHGLREFRRELRQAGQQFPKELRQANREIGRASCRERVYDDV